MDPNVWWGRLLNMIIQTLDQLGLVSPSEPTVMHIVAMVLLAANDNATIHINPTDAYSKANDIKRELKAVRLRTRLAHHGVIINYPADVETFKQLHDAQFASFYKIGTTDEFEAVPCPIEEHALNQLRMRLPARRSHTSISLSSRMHTVSTNKSSSRVVNQMLSDPVSLMMLANMQRQQTPATGMELPGLVIHDRSRSPRGRAQASQAAAALCDGSLDSDSQSRDSPVAEVAGVELSLIHI